MRDMATVKPLPEQASDTARAKRFYGYTKRHSPQALAGLGIIDTDACLWAKTVRPHDVETLFLVPSLPTMKMKPAPTEYEYEQGITEGYAECGGGESVLSGFVCAVNRFVNEYPLLTGIGLTALLTGGLAAKRKRAARRVTARRRAR